MSSFAKRIMLLAMAVICLLLVSQQFALAQDSGNEDEELSQPQKGHPGYFAAGSLYLQTFSPDLTPLNDQIQQMGLLKLNPVVFQYGVQAFGSIQKKWRVGIFYYAGTSSTTGTVNDSVFGFQGTYPFDKSATIWIKGGGLSGGYRITLPNSFELEPSLWLGMAFIDVELSQTDSRVDWNEVWFGYRRYSGTIQQTLSSYYTYAEPGIIARYYVRPWVAIGLGAQYVVPITKAQSWNLSGYKVKNARTFDPSSLSSMFIVSFGI